MGVIIMQDETKEYQDKLIEAHFLKGFVNSVKNLRSKGWKIDDVIDEVYAEYEKQPPIMTDTPIAPSIKNVNQRPTRAIYDKATGEILAEVDASKSINKANLEDGIGVTDGYAQHSYYLAK